MPHYPRRAAAAIAAAVLLACTSTPAQAVTLATTTTASQAVSSGSWGAVASKSTAAPYGSGPLTLSFTNNGNPAHPSFTPKYFTIGNTGTIPITQANYVGTTTAPSTVRFIIESCTSTWNETTGACPGGTVATVLTTPWGTSTIPATSGPAPADSGTAIRLRARITFSGSVPKTPAPTLTIGITVDRTQVRTGTTTGG
ncbi:hypothetical protein [Arthrobacter sp. 2MCAF14]|uniref:hypothetical protein n=1 Tax=Arthrobacter sp. 2MCAF14 TaxID=3232982 RepID=UPI003F8F7450